MWFSMDILCYEDMLQGLKDYNNSLSENYGNTVTRTRTYDTKYPLTVFSEIRNVSNPNYKSIFDRVSSVGYMVKIYAKTKGKIDKSIIARSISKIIDDFIYNVSKGKLTRSSFNANEAINDNSLYEIIVTYTGNLHENKRKFI